MQCVCVRRSDLSDEVLAMRFASRALFTACHALSSEVAKICGGSGSGFALGSAALQLATTASDAVRMAASFMWFGRDKMVVGRIILILSLLFWLLSSTADGDAYTKTKGSC